MRTCALSEGTKVLLRSGDANVSAAFSDQAFLFLNSDIRLKILTAATVPGKL
jgi:hypothetical protein